MDIIVDLDGTLCDCTWRLPLIQQKPKNWKEFFAGIPRDACVEPVATLVYHFAECPANNVVFSTGRPRSTENDTILWLKRNDMWMKNSRLYMRGTKDFRPDYVTKRDLLTDIINEGFRPVLAIDDKPEVCDMYEQVGLNVLRVGLGKKVNFDG